MYIILPVTYLYIIVLGSVAANTDGVTRLKDGASNRIRPSLPANKRSSLLVVQSIATFASHERDANKDDEIHRFVFFLIAQAFFMSNTR